MIFIDNYKKKKNVKSILNNLAKNVDNVKRLKKI